MNKQELVARCAVLLIIVAFPVSVFAYQYVYLPTTDGEAQAIDLVARAPEAGGWSPEIITVEKGDTVQLRITGHDVVHGFAIGGLGIDVGQIIPGEATTVEFVVDEVFGNASSRFGPPGQTIILGGEKPSAHAIRLGVFQQR